eukprot:2636502-Prymnesium_polylepis.2
MTRRAPPRKLRPLLATLQNTEQTVRDVPQLVDGHTGNCAQKSLEAPTRDVTLGKLCKERSSMEVRWSLSLGGGQKKSSSAVITEASELLDVLRFDSGSAPVRLLRRSDIRSSSVPEVLQLFLVSRSLTKE